MRNPYLYLIVGAIVIVLLYVYLRSSSPKKVSFNLDENKEVEPVIYGTLPPDNEVSNSQIDCNSLFSHKYQFVVDTEEVEKKFALKMPKNNIVSFDSVTPVSNETNGQVKMTIASDKSKGSYVLVYHVDGPRVILAEGSKEMFIISKGEHGVFSIRLLDIEEEITGERFEHTLHQIN